jgi:hypothetical protein
MLGSSLSGQGKLEEAEPLLTSGYEGMVKRQARLSFEDRALIAEAGNRLVNLYKAWGKPDKAAEWEARLKQATSGSLPSAAPQR